MKLEYDEVFYIYESYQGWCGGDGEFLWYKKAWMALEKGGLTSYESLVDKSLVLIRAFTLMMIYKEYCEFAFEEDFDYEFTDWDETPGLSAFRVGQMTSKFLEDDDFADVDDYDCDDSAALQDAFLELVDSQRYKIVECLIKNIGKGGESTILVCMYLTRFDFRKYEENEIDSDEDQLSIFSEELTYEEYEKAIGNYYSDIVNDPTIGNLKAFEWLTQGTYKLR